MDARNLSFGTNSFDHVIASYVLTAVKYPRQVLREMLRVCKPGGRVVILNHTPPRSRLLRKGEQIMSPLCSKIGWTPKIDVEAILADENIEPMRVQKVNLFRIHKLIVFENPVNGNAI